MQAFSKENKVPCPYLVGYSPAWDQCECLDILVLLPTWNPSNVELLGVGGMRRRAADANAPYPIPGG